MMIVGSQVIGTHKFEQLVLKNFHGKWQYEVCIEYT